jgi:hypothetical protein
VKKIFTLIIVFLVSISVFGQNTELSDSLKTLKKTLKKHAVYTPSKRDRTVFWGRNFNNCNTEYSFISKLSSPSAAMVEFRPIASSTGTFNTTNSPTVLSRDTRTGGVIRDPNVSRSNQISQPGYPRSKNSKFKALNFKFVVLDSITFSNEKEENRYSVSFSIKEITEEYKIDDKQTIFLKFKKKEEADLFLESFKKVASLCQTQ